MRIHCSTIRLTFAPFALLLLMPVDAFALDIQLDYATSFVSTNATARATIDKAAADISAAITSQLAPIDQNQWSRTIGPTSNQEISGDYTWTFSYTVPGEADSTVVIPSLAANQVKLFVRGQDIPAGTLGTGGSAGVGFGASYGASFPQNGLNKPLLQTQFEQLVDQQSALANAEFDRGAGPVISSISGTSLLDFPSTIDSPDAMWNYDVSYGPAYGTLAFDTSIPNGKTFEEFWHLDYNTPVASGKNDLYSVALHEILHALGYGSSETWDDLTQGTSWNGPEVIAENGGSGTTLISASHVFPGVMSRSIVDGATQEVAMDPNLTVGTRKYLTTLDLAFLRDLNYSTIDPIFTNPVLFGDADNDSAVAGSDLLAVTNNFGSTGLANGLLLGDADDDGAVAGSDLLAVTNNFGATLPSSLQTSVVPEPAAGCALLIALGCCSLAIGHHRRPAVS